MKKISLVVIFLVVYVASAFGQDGIISTIAGTGSTGYSGDGGAASAARLNAPAAVAFDDTGNLYIADRSSSVIRKVSTSGVVTTIAGLGYSSYSGDGSPAVYAGLSSPSGITVDHSGNVYIADTRNNVIRQIDRSGIIHTVAGTGSSGYDDGGGIATAATLASPTGVTVDLEGNVFFTDKNNNCLRKLGAYSDGSGLTGDISTIAGSTTSGYSGDGGPSNSALLNSPTGITQDRLGNIYFVDAGNNCVRKIGNNDTIITIAGNGSSAHDGDYGAATNAGLYLPYGLTTDEQGHIYISESNYSIRRIDENGVITTSTYGVGGDAGLAVKVTGDLLFTSSAYHKVQQMTRSPAFTESSTQSFTMLPGTGSQSINKPLSVLYALPGQTISWTISVYPRHGSATSTYSTTSAGGILTPSGMFYTPTSGYLGLDSFEYEVTEGLNVHAKKIIVNICSAFSVRTIAGNSSTGYSGDAGLATAAVLNQPSDITTDRYGNVLFCDNNSTGYIRKISTNGYITKVAGGGTYGSFHGRGGFYAESRNQLAVNAEVDYITDVCVSANNEVYFSGGTGGIGSQVNKINKNGVISTVAGWGYGSGMGYLDNMPATNSAITAALGISVDNSGNVLIAQCNNGSSYSDARIRKVSFNGMITTIAGVIGDGSHLYGGDGGPATNAQMNRPIAVARDAIGGIYIADAGNHTIRLITASGIIHTIGGTGISGYTGDGGSAVTARIGSPTAIIVDAVGNVYFSDVSYHCIRMINTSGIISTIAGTGSAGFSGDSSLAGYAQFNYPNGIAKDNYGNIYVADQYNHRIRKISACTPPTTAPITGPTTVNTGSTITLADATAGGTWSPSSTGRATVSSGGVVTGVSAGAVTITYSVTNTCGTARVTKNITVINPHAPVFPVGSQTNKGACKDQAISIEANLAVRDVDAGQTLTWSMLSAPRHGTASVAGTATSTGGTVRPTGRIYTPTTGYTGMDTFTVRVSDGTYTSDLVMYMTVNNAPATPSISGVTPICLNDSISLSATPTGGVFNSTGGGILCRPTGMVKGLNAGVYTVTYTTAANSFGCKSTVSSAITIRKRLSASSITGGSVVCTGSSITLNNDSTGGTWAVTNTTLATVADGMVYGISVGIDTVTYSYTNVCGTGVATRRITINPAPNAGTITGPDTVMMGGYINLTRTTTSVGTWSSSDNTIASVNTVGRVRGNGAGVDTIRYSVTNSCGTAVARKTITVYSMGGKAAGEATGTAIATKPLKVWPNPSEGTINLELPEAGATILVLDAAGRTVYTATTTEAQASINLSELPGGTYLLRVLCGGNVYAERVVIE